jgi:hypothetical protein
MNRKLALTERLKEIYESRSKVPIYDISRYIRAAGYYTQLHMYNINLLGNLRGFDITGAKEKKNLKYRSYDDEIKPDVVVSVTKMDFIAQSCEFDIICPPDENLEALEIIVRDSLSTIFSNVSQEVRSTESQDDTPSQ